jgi:nitroimidazol reductase NimA-like FMN-containing flavoprotein (pyridoxamine 5'-phosphate oxidase superfamily)
MGNEMLEIMLKKVTARMPRDELEQHIIEFIKSHNMCVMATAKDNVPRATAIEYFSVGTTIYVVGDPGTKIEHMKANPQVSISIHDPYTGFFSVKAIVITGKPTLISDSDPEYSEAWRICQWEKVSKELGLTEFPKGVLIIKIEAKSIKLLENVLKLKGYDSTQLWEASEG